MTCGREEQKKGFATDHPKSDAANMSRREQTALLLAGVFHIITASAGGGLKIFSSLEYRTVEKPNPAEDT